MALSSGHFPKKRQALITPSTLRMILSHTTSNLQPCNVIQALLFRHLNFILFADWLGLLKEASFQTSVAPMGMIRASTPCRRMVGYDRDTTILRRGKFPKIRSCSVLFENVLPLWIFLSVLTSFSFSLFLSSGNLFSVFLHSKDDPQASTAENDSSRGLSATESRDHKW